MPWGRFFCISIPLNPANPLIGYVSKKNTLVCTKRGMDTDIHCRVVYYKNNHPQIENKIIFRNRGEWMVYILYSNPQYEILHNN